VDALTSRWQTTIRKSLYVWALSLCFKVCLYRTRPRTWQRFGGVREGMVEIKQTKVVHTERDRATRL